MTREIKFRAWLKKEKRIIEPVIQLYFGHMPYIGWYETEQDALEGKLTTAFMDEVVLMEWTGSRDKNGKKIYEGDIIETEKMEYSVSGHYIGMVKVLGKVVFNNGRYALHLETGAMPDLNFGSSFHRVIGNIYEHPHLLKGDENE